MSRSFELLSDALHYIIDSYDLTQASFADSIGVSLRQVSRWMNRVNEPKRSIISTINTTDFIPASIIWTKNNDNDTYVYTVVEKTTTDTPPFNLTDIELSKEPTTYFKDYPHSTKELKELLNFLMKQYRFNSEQIELCTLKINKLIDSDEQHEMELRDTQYKYVEVLSTENRQIKRFIAYILKHY